MPQIQAGTTGILDVTFYSAGAPVDPAPSPQPTCTVVDAAGNAVASGDATVVGGSTGRLTFTLSPAETTQPNLLTVTWANVKLGSDDPITQVTSAEVLGELLFTLAEARAYDDAALSDASKYPDDTILRGRDLILDAFQRITWQSFGTRYEREVLDGPLGFFDSTYGRGLVTGALELKRQQVQRIRSIKERTVGTQTWTAYSQADLDDVLLYPNGQIVRETRGAFAGGRLCIAVEYEHGWAPIPEEIRQAALRLLRSQLVSSNLPDRATSQSNEFGTFALAVAGKPGQWFGIPLVDSVIQRYRDRVPSVR